MAERDGSTSHPRASRPLSAFLRHRFRFRTSASPTPPRSYKQPRSSPSGLATAVTLLSQPASLPASKCTSRVAQPDDAARDSANNESAPEAEPPPQPLTRPYAEFAAVFDKIGDTPAASLRLVSPNAKQSLLQRAALIDTMPDPAPQQ